MVVGVRYTCGDHFTAYTSIESLCCTPGSNNMRKTIVEKQP